MGKASPPINRNIKSPVGSVIDGSIATGIPNYYFTDDAKTNQYYTDDALNNKYNTKDI